MTLRIPMTSIDYGPDDGNPKSETPEQLHYRIGKLGQQISWLNRQMDLLSERNRELEAALKPNLFKTADQLPAVTTETETNQSKPLDYELELFVDKHLFNIFFQHRPTLYQPSVFKLKIKEDKIMDVAFKE